MRFIQALLVVIAAALLMSAGYSMGRSTAVRGDDLTPARAPGAGQTIVLAILGASALGAALALQGGGGVRLPTPRRLREMEAALDNGPVPIDETPDDQVTADTSSEHTA